MLRIQLQIARTFVRENTILLAIVEALADCDDEASCLYAYGLCERMSENINVISLMTGIPVLSEP